MLAEAAVEAGAHGRGCEPQGWALPTTGSGRGGLFGLHLELLAQQHAAGLGRCAARLPLTPQHACSMHCCVTFVPPHPVGGDGLHVCEPMRQQPVPPTQLPCVLLAHRHMISPGLHVQQYGTLQHAVMLASTKAAAAAAAAAACGTLVTVRLKLGCAKHAAAGRLPGCHGLCS